MNQIQLQAMHYKQELLKANAKIREMAEAMNEKSLIDRLILAAVQGACARLSDPKEVAAFSVKVAEELLETFRGADDAAAQAEPAEEPTKEELDKRVEEMRQPVPFAPPAPAPESPL